MPTAFEAVFPIEQVYEDAELRTATAGRRLAAYVIDTVIAVFTLYIVWFVWFAFVAARGQTPGKQLVDLYVVREDGTRAGGWYMWLREGVVKILFFTVLGLVSGGIIWLIGALWLLWDRDRQCLWDKIVQTHVGFSPHRFVPETKEEQEFSGQIRRRAPGQQQTRPVGGAPAGQAPVSPADSPAERLRELRRLRDDELITEQEYEARRAEAVKDL